MVNPYAHMWRISNDPPTPPSEPEDEDDEDKADVDAGSSSEEEDEPEHDPKPFSFLDLPSEIRNRIYTIILTFQPLPPPKGRKKKRPSARERKIPAALAAQLPLRKRTAILLCNSQIHAEASYILYSTKHTLLFPVYREPYAMNLRDIPAQYVPCIATLELNLGSNWEAVGPGRASKPSQQLARARLRQNIATKASSRTSTTSTARSLNTNATAAQWTVTPDLHLDLLHSLRTLSIFVQIDPSHPVFDGFRISAEFYTDFAGDLLRDILALLPASVRWVSFEGNPSVEKEGDLMRRLREEVWRAGREVVYKRKKNGIQVNHWGRREGWVWDEEDELLKGIVEERMRVEKENGEETDGEEKELRIAVEKMGLV